MLNVKQGSCEQRWDFRTSTPRTGAEPQFRSGIDGAEPAEKKVRNEGCGTTKNNFRTDRKLFPFEWQYCNILV